MSSTWKLLSSYCSKNYTFLFLQSAKTCMYSLVTLHIHWPYVMMKKFKITTRVPSLTFNTPVLYLHSSIQGLQPARKLAQLYFYNLDTSCAFSFNCSLTYWQERYTSTSHTSAVNYTLFVYLSQSVSGPQLRIFFFFFVRLSQFKIIDSQYFLSIEFLPLPSFWNPSNRDVVSDLWQKAIATYILKQALNIIREAKTMI